MKNMSLTQEQRQAIIDENRTLTAVGTRIDVSFSTTGTYDAMDANGNLFLNGEATGKKLYKHTGSVGLYGGDVSDKEPGVVKKLTYQNRGGGYNLTGLYAAPGEVIKIRISAEDIAKTKGLVVYIGQALYNGQANNIWASKGVMNRMPVILNQMTLTTSTTTAKIEKNGDYTFYVGSFLGGPVYVRPGQSNSTEKFSVTISGAVNYPHFILGYTSEKEFNKLLKSSVPFFDLLVWDGGVLHSGPRSQVAGFSYSQLYDAAVLWEKISAVSTRMSNTSVGIVFLYDPFVAAGAAVAFPGRNSVNCPTGWMKSSLNYDAFVKSGSWGNVHEYHHNFQSGWGLPGGGEVTNNALSLVSYSLFTKISSARKIGTASEGLGGWNRYTSGSWALNAVKSGSVGSTNQLSVYATLLHNFGQEAFITTRGSGINGYFTQWAETTHNDMTFFADLYASKIPAESRPSYYMSDATKAAMAAKNYPMFVPISSIYQTGRSYMYDGEKRYIETMQPYVISYGEDFTVDLRPYTYVGGYYESGSISIPDGFSIRVKNITQPEHGKITATETEGVYTFTPSGDSLRSGKIYVTLEITKDDGAFEVDDVDLVLEFEQTHETKKNVLVRTTYTYDQDKAYTSATEAYDAKFAGYTTVERGDNQNPYLDGRLVQNCNTDIWYTDPNLSSNHVVTLEGKLYIAEAGKYRIALRGRWNCALYLSYDNGKTYTLAATQINNASANFSTAEGTYVDKEMVGDKWIYFKMVMVTGRVGNSNSYMGLGLAKWTSTQPTFDEKGNIIEDGKESVNISGAYATAYRSTYEFPAGKFETEYFSKRTFTKDYEKEYGYMPDAKIVSFNTESAAPNGETTYDIENILDKDENNAFHSKYLVANQPVEVVVDLGKEISANIFVLQGYKDLNGYWHVPNSFKIYVGKTQDKLTEVFSVTGGEVKSDGTSQAYFNAAKTQYTFRYYKLVITGTSRNRYVAFRWIKFYHRVDGGKIITPDDDMFLYKGKWSKKNAFSTYGHIYSGKDASVEFTFTGKQFGVLSYISKSYKSFEVLIDGKVVGTANINEKKNATGWAYISPILENKEHKVVIRSKKAFNIDSIALWQ